MHGLVKSALESFEKGKKLLTKVTKSKKYKHWMSGSLTGVLQKVKKGQST